METKDMEKKLILHLCADLGSDSLFYQRDPAYKVIMVGEKIGVQNFHAPKNTYGIISNPVCTKFSTAAGFNVKQDLSEGMFLVDHCTRIVNEAKQDGKLKFHVMENPQNGRLKEVIGAPVAKYQPWQYGSPWTKLTALWGEFVMPDPIYKTWYDCPKIEGLYVRPGRSKPGLVYMHKSAVDLIPEFQWAKEHIKNDADLRSMCSTGFAKSFYLSNQ